MLIRAIFAVALIASCASKDNSADTDQASKDVRSAQSEVSEKRTELTDNRDDIETKKREIARIQQELADKQAALDGDRQQLGSAQGTLVEARAAYAAAVKQRFTKLDAELAGLATRVDAASTDANAGLVARRNLLATKLSTLPAEADAGWTTFTKDVDTTFDAIERDLRAATH